MKNLLVYYAPTLTTKLEDIPLPSYAPNELLIKVLAAGSNPKDWKHPHPTFFNICVNQGDDVAGIVSAVGSAVKNFRPGDRVAGMHVMDTPHGTYAEYTVCPENTVFHIPESFGWEEAATIPLAMYTAAVGLYRNLNLPLPTARSDEESAVQKIPLVINGASSAVGAFALKLAKLSPSIGPIIVTAGSSASYVESIGGADVILDYRSPSIASELRKALDGKKLFHVFDASNSLASVGYLTEVLEPTGRYTCTTAVGKSFYSPIGEQQIALEKWGGWFEQIWVGSIHEDKLLGGIWFGSVVSRLVEVLLEEGMFSGHVYEIVEGGLHGVEAALIKLRDRKGGNEKFVTRIGDTVGVESS
ncbi:GroES-like protein [Amniculicola lignicola CBS 123094]|uniref:GroES-like protein n=1 Tax=Amniculicola lignicola CBS 123094 TaxID=1392246 RepID=A0A6A5VTP8_9PLEO|nr:GroES-like protein [Amniculicola lignicola CBS 123094]